MLHMSESAQLIFIIGIDKTENMACTFLCRY